MATEAYESPQYIVVRKSATEEFVEGAGANCPYFYGNSRTCVVYKVGLMDMYKDDEPTRKAVLRYGFREIRDRIFPASSPPSQEVDKRRRVLATMVMLDTLNVSQAEQPKLKQLLKELLEAARDERMPIIINLDTVNWWDRRSDLHTLPDGGLLPDNVEETVDGGRVGIGWRNWGSQLRVNPSPNLAATGFRQANAEVLELLLPELSSFYASLPPEDKYLYGGLVLGTEIAIGVSNYFYPGGNSYITTGAATDPGICRATDDAGVARCNNEPRNCSLFHHDTCLPDFKQDLSGGVAQIGYAAARKLNLPLGPNDTMTRQALDGIVVDYLGFLNHYARFTNVPTHKVVAHVGGNFGVNGPHSMRIGRYAGLIPGWSFYNKQTRYDESGSSTDPDLAIYLAEYFDEPNPIPWDLRALPWASPEWLPYNPQDTAPTAGDWLQALEDTAGYRNNRMVTVANWEDIKPYQPPIDAIRAALTQIPNTYCNVNPSLDVGHAPLTDADGGYVGTGVRILTSGTNVLETRPEATYLLVSKSSALGLDGVLTNPDPNDPDPYVVNADVTDMSSYTVSSATGGTFYLQLVSDGCSLGYPFLRKRVMSPVTSITVGARSSTNEGSYPRIFSRVEGGLVTLSWEFKFPNFIPLTHSVYLNASTEPTVTNINVINANVTGTKLFTRTGIGPGTYYARVKVSFTGMNGQLDEKYSNTLMFQVQ